MEMFSDIEHGDASDSKGSFFQPPLSVRKDTAALSVALYDFKRKVSNYASFEGYQMVLPWSFNRKLRRQWGYVHLRIKGGRVGHVDLEDRFGELQLGREWTTFLDHYKILRSYTMNFYYEGASSFQVQVFNKSRVRIQYYTYDFRCECYPPGTLVITKEEEYDDCCSPDVVKAIRSLKDQVYEKEIERRKEAEGKYCWEQFRSLWTRKKHLRPDIDPALVKEGYAGPMAELYISSFDIEATEKRKDEKMRVLRAKRARGK